MAKRLQLRRGTTSQHSSFTGAVGEVTVDTDKKVVVVHDGSTAGGVPLATAADIAGKQASDAELTALAGLTSAADKGIQFTGSGTAGVYDLTAFAKTILEDADAAAVRTTIGAQASGSYQASDADLTAIAGLTSAADKGIQFTGSGTAGVYDLTAFAKTILDDADAAAVRTTIGAGTGAGDATLAGDNTWTGSQRGEVSDVGTKTANFDFDLDTSNNFKITIGANAKEFGFTNIDAGQSGTIEVVNGAYTLSYGSECHFPGGTPPTLTQSATSFLAYYCPSDSVVIVQNILDVKAQS